MTSYTRAWAAAVVITAFCISLSTCKPRPQNWPFDKEPPYYQDECTDSSIKKAEVETLCQRCASRTKSTIVYPMCCEGREATREWCEKYLSYGRQ